MSVNIWESWPSYVDSEWASPTAPWEDAEIGSSTTGLRLRLLERMMPPVMAMDLPLEVVPLLVVGFFFGPWLFEGF